MLTRLESNLLNNILLVKFPQLKMVMQLFNVIHSDIWASQALSLFVNSQIVIKNNLQTVNIYHWLFNQLIAGFDTRLNYLFHNLFKAQGLCVFTITIDINVPFNVHHSRHYWVFPPWLTSGRRGGRWLVTWSDCPPLDQPMQCDANNPMKCNVNAWFM